jgi:hypothetical protein
MATKDSPPAVLRCAQKMLATNSHACPALCGEITRKNTEIQATDRTDPHGYINFCNWAFIFSVSHFDV